jgi:hypothetical protein
VVLCFGAMNLLLHSKLSYLEAEELAPAESGAMPCAISAMSSPWQAISPVARHRVPPVESGSPVLIT